MLLGQVTKPPIMRERVGEGHYHDDDTLHLKGSIDRRRLNDDDDCVCSDCSCL